MAENTQATGQPAAERADGVCLIDDGYTLSGVVGDADKKGQMTIVYRPCQPDDTYKYRRQVQVAQFANDGKAHLAAVADLLNDHIESWTGLYAMSAAGRRPVPFVKGTPAAPGSFGDVKVLRTLGAAFLDEMVNYVTGYALGQWVADSKNS